MPQLQVLNGPLQWKTIAVEGPRFVIGRRKGCHLILDDGWVSREHTVIIEPSPGVFLAKDLNSENGSYVNGRRIVECQLKPQDVVRIGRTEMRFVVGMVERNDPSPPQTQVVETGGFEASAVADDITVVPGRLSGVKPPVAVDPGEQTSRVADTDALPRRDLKEQTRKLERLLERQEEENARLAAENAVLKRGLVSAGALDRSTGAIDLARLGRRGDAVPPPSWPIGATLEFPLGSGESLRMGDPGAFESRPGVLSLNVVGLGAEGCALVDQLESLGYRCTLRLPDAFLPEPEGLLPERDVDLLLAGAPTEGEPTAGTALQILDGLGEEEEGRSRLTGLVIPSGTDSDARGFLEAGRLDFCFLSDAAHAPEGTPAGSPVATALALFDRAARTGGAATAKLAGEFRRFLAEGRACTLGLGAASSIDGAGEAVNIALTSGLHCDLGQLSRVRLLQLLVLVGSDQNLDTEVENTLRASIEEVSRGQLPQARPRVTILEDGAEGLRCIAFVGGVPWPDGGGGSGGGDEHLER